MTISNAATGAQPECTVGGANQPFTASVCAMYSGAAIAMSGAFTVAAAVDFGSPPLKSRMNYSLCAARLQGRTGRACRTA